MMLKTKCLELVGKDSLSFINALCTQDVKANTINPVDAFLLNNKGRIVAYISTINPVDTIYVSFQEEFVGVKEHLEKYIISEDVTIIEQHIIEHEGSEEQRILQGEPRYQDLINRSPLETNIQNAITSNKGCYLGQEVITRSRNFGVIKNSFKGFLLGKAFPEISKGVEITSFIYSNKYDEYIGLGYVSYKVDITSLPFKVIDLPFEKDL